MNIRTHRKAVLEKTLARYQQHIALMERLLDRLAFFRLTVFLGGGMAGSLLYLLNGMAGSLLMLLTALVFIVLALRHRRVHRHLSKYRVWQAMKRSWIARMELDWVQLEPPLVAESGEHPFNHDLEITGERSLHRLLNLNISSEGSARLADWLLNTHPEQRIIEERQAIVRELRDLPGFRENLIWQFRRISARQLQGGKLLHGLSHAATAPPSIAFLVLMSLLLVATLTMGLLHLAGVLSHGWLPPLILYVLLYFGNSGRINHLFDTTLLLSDELAQLDALLRFLRGYSYRRAPQLAYFCEPFRSSDGAQALIRRTRRIVLAVGFRMNPVVMMMLNLLLPYDYLLARILWQARNALLAELPRWLEIWAQLEAMTALATFGWLNPHYSFPQFSAAGEAESAVLQGEEIGHPLLEEQGKIRNDIRYAQIGETLLITGSNMSGKSTFLKTLGINLALAFAAGPVDARRLRLQPLRLFTSIQVSDSLADGFSYFYAEVRRLKALLDALVEKQQLPLFFLIDEIFRGTNNRERYQGSKAYIAALVGRNGIGAISTHDLELTALVATMEPLRNMHFREEVRDGRMTFDFKLHSGPCPTTNALTIMRLAGLPVGDQ